MILARTFLFLSLLVFVAKVFADEGPSAIPTMKPGSKESEERLLFALQRGEAKVVEHKSVEIEPRAPRQEGDQRKQRSVDSKAEVTRLLEEVEKLKTSVVLTKKEAFARQTPRGKKATGAKTHYDYQEGAVYELHAAVDRISCLEFGVGERLTSTPVSGDTVRWKTALNKAGEGESERTILVIKPLEEGIETNFLITTNKRSYHIRALSSAETYMPAIAWNYPDEEAEKGLKLAEQSKQEERVALNVAALRFDYEITGAKVAWRPLRVFDDGVKTYVQMPKEVAALELPAFFVVSEDGEAMLVNYRVLGDYYVVDRLFKRALLRVGQEDEVEITAASFNPSLWSKIF